MCGNKGSWTSLGGTLWNYIGSIQSSHMEEKKVLDAKGSLSRIVTCGQPSKFIYGEKTKTKGSLSRRIACGLWGFTFDSPNLLY